MREKSGITVTIPKPPGQNSRKKYKKREAKPATRAQIPQANRNAVMMAPATAIREQLRECEADCASARDCASWSALSALLRLKRQLWIDLHAAEEVEAAHAATAAARADEAVSDDEVFADVLAGLMSLPLPLRERLATALAGGPSLRVVGE